MAAQRLVGDGIFIIGSVQFAGNLQLHGGFGRQDGLRVAPVRIRGGGHLQIGRRQSRVGHHIDADLVRRSPTLATGANWPKITSACISLRSTVMRRSSTRVLPVLSLALYRMK